MDATIQAALNAFSLSQPALQLAGLPFPASAIQLGDVIAEEASGDASAAEAAAEAAQDSADAAQADATQALSDAADALAAAEDAESQAYTAAVAGDWSGNAPTTLKAALDRLAAALGPIA